MTLRCTGGGTAPAGLADGLQRLHRLPPEAREKIWQVLGPSLADPVPKETEQHLDVFCAAYHADGDDIARAIKACRFVVRAGAKLDVPADALAEDLEALCPGDPLVKAVVLTGYEPARAQLRRAMIMAALVDNGKLLTGVTWRRDAIEASEQGSHLGMPVTLLTLHFRDGGDAGRVTVQALPDLLEQLRMVCDAALGRPPGAGERA